MSEILLQIKDIKKHYRNGKKVTEALKGVTIDIIKGEIITLLGVNGAGKTTLSSIIASLHPPTSGNVLFAGKSIYTDIAQYRKHIGFCPQQPNLEDSLSLRDVLMFSGRYYLMPEEQIKARLLQLADQLGLSEYLDQAMHVLSGGYKQRFMIARSLMHNPQIVLLDEPTVGLDPHIRRQLWTIIKELKDTGVTVILTTHYMDEAEKLSDRVCVLDKGLIKLIDTPDKLLSDFKKSNLEDVFLAIMQEN